MVQRSESYARRLVRACARQTWTAALILPVALIAILSTGAAIDPPREQTVYPWPKQGQEPSDVRRLGLSATLVSRDEAKAPVPSKVDVAKDDASDLELGDVALGDTVTVTSPDGASKVYKVISGDLEVSTPNSAIAEGGSQGDACIPLASVTGSLRLILETIHAGKAPAAPSAEQRL